MNSETLSAVDVSRRRRGVWRKQSYDKVHEISPILAEGLFAHYKNWNAIRPAQEALKAMDASARQAVWQVTFPRIAELVEIAWQHLPAEKIARRDSGAEGNGEPFTWSLTQQEADDFKFEWLRKLLIIVGPFPELEFPDVMRQLGHIAVGRIEEADLDHFKDTTGLHYDSDAPAYLAATLLSRMPGSEISREIESILDRELLGKEPNGSKRATKTAWICSDRPDLWQKLDAYLIDAGNEPGFQESLMSSRIGGHPGSWLHLLETIRDHDLLRFEFIDYWARYNFRIDWQWKSHKRDDVHPWFERWVEMHENPQLRDKAYRGNHSGDFTLALWAEATIQGDVALDKISDSSELKPDLRIAAAHFLRLCPAKRSARLVLDYATDTDLRVANVAAPLLTAWRVPVLGAQDSTVRFERLCEFLRNLPEKISLPPNPEPFLTTKPNFEGITYTIADSFPDGAEGIIEGLLPVMDTSARNAVVSRLNRYRLMEENRSIAKIIHGSSQEEWENWLKDNQGTQLYHQRRLLLTMLGDRSMEVAEHAFKAVKDFTISSEEAALLRPILASSSVKKHLFVTHLYAQQPPNLIARLLPDLIKSKRIGERMAALEIFRRLTENESTLELAKSLWEKENYEPQKPEEQRAYDVLKSVLKKSESIESVAEAPAFHNAFGMVDPRNIIDPVEPQEHNIILHSPITKKLILWLDEWLVNHADVMIPTTRFWMNDQLERIGDTGVPSVRRDLTVEANLIKFPPALGLAEAWDNRPPEQRDPDGHELLRLPLALSPSGGRVYHVLNTLFGLEEEVSTKSKTYCLQYLISWIKFLRPEDDMYGDWRNYLIDAAETAYVRLSDKFKGSAYVWAALIEERLIRKDDCPDEILKRIWSLARGPKEFRTRPFGFGIYDVAIFHQRGIATDDEVTWRLIGPRRFHDKYDQKSAFSDLASVTQIPGPYHHAFKPPAFRALIDRICDRVVDLELSRGEVPELWSHAANSIKRIYGARHLQRLLLALGKLPLTRKRRGSDDVPDLTRPAVLIHLISVCHPAENDNADDFKNLMAEAKIPTDRLLEISIFRPVWTEFIEHSTGIRGLRDAVGWIFAHTRSQDYVWGNQARELWAGELNFETAITPEEFIDGAVDTDWFARVFSAVGENVWNKLYIAAKFASTGRGHTRARLFADALMNKIEVNDLKVMLEKDGNLDAALAIGLPSFPSDPKSRTAELLKRYEVLQSLKLRAKKSKAQRAASEQKAYDIGVQNLARRVGYSDTVRFEWAMETEAVSDMGSLCTVIDDITLAIQITPGGILELQAVREGKALKTIPPVVKKNTDFITLRDRMAALKQQALRLRPALEDLMVRHVSLSSEEWQKLILHPLAGPLLRRLALSTEREIIGFPSEAGLHGIGGKITPWPSGQTEIYIAHAVDLLPPDVWHSWQKEIFDRQITQPFKQIFREVYLPTETEIKSKHGQIDRFHKPRLVTHKLLGILSKRGWIFHPEHGLNRLFRKEGITAWISFDEYFHHPSECAEAHLSQVYFTTAKPFKTLTIPSIPTRIFSEVLRDIDLIVSVAHASGVNPEITQSTIESRMDLVRETCRLLKIANVAFENKHVLITGKLANYRIHLDSGIVHRVAGAMIPIVSDTQTERGHIFLPFADADVQSADILSRVLLFANDESIRDPQIAKALRSSS